MLLDVRWKNIDRAVPYVGWLKSESGDVQLALVEGQQDIFVATKVSTHEKTHVTCGHVPSQIEFKE